MTQANSQLTPLRVEKVVYGGSGLARAVESAEAGRPVFVPFTLPDEVVEARIADDPGNIAVAAVEQIVQASHDRVEPRCAHFGACGGCHYQHASYEAQLRLKHNILYETLERAGLEELPAITVHSGEPWEYRNRVRLRVAKVDGKFRVGYLRRSSTEFLPIRMCPISAPLLWRAAEAFLAMGSNAAQWMAATEEIELFTSADQSMLQMTIFVRREPRGFSEFCETLKKDLPELAGAGVALMESAGHGRKSLRIRAGSAWGADGLSYAVGNENYWISRGGFFQVNRHIVAPLVELVTKGRSGKLAWDLYAGVGLFSRPLATTFAEVVAVEAAANDLVRSFRGKGQRAIAATTLEFLRQAVLERERPELVVMDPPRAGVGAEVCDLLSRVKAAEMVYVSCDPTTLGRDLKAVVDSGYRLHQLHLVDMFPQTFHQETVAVLRR